MTYLKWKDCKEGLSRLVGLVVKAFIMKVADRGWFLALSVGIFLGQVIPVT